MSLKTIYDSLYSEIKNPYGVCGLMGNLKAESGLVSNNLQNTYNKKFGLTDQEYTEKVDNGSYVNFVHDSAGYGLAQWTFYSRKQNLLYFAKSKRVSIGDEKMQVEFLLNEIKGYSSVWKVLVNAKTIKEASDAVLTGYEKPANQSESVKKTRAGYGQEIYDSIFKDEPKSNSVSPLVDITVLSPNHSGKRTHTIDCITPHCVVGQASVETLGNIFKNPAKNASCNYGIGFDGRVALIVDEGNRSWCSSSNANDQRAVTIECASDSFAPYAFNDRVYNKLIDLCVDICKRNGKNILLWKPNKDEALNYSPSSNEMLLTVHRWFANKSCPGDWMYNRMGDLANEVTKRLGGSPKKPEETKDDKEVDTKITNYKVRINITNLNIRKGPGTNYPKTGKATGVGVFTIVEESVGVGSKKGWGKLKSGAGWISLDYANKI